MYLEFLPDELPPDYPLLIFSPAVPEEVEQLYQALRDIVTVSGAVVDIHSLPFISPVDGCRLSAQVIDEDIGVVLIKNTQNHFTWKLTREVWKDVLNLLYPFTLQDCCDGTYLLETLHGTEFCFTFRNCRDGTVHGFQWLDVTGDGISVIISTMHRQW